MPTVTGTLDDTATTVLYTCPAQTNQKIAASIAENTHTGDAGITCDILKNDGTVIPILLEANVIATKVSVAMGYAGFNLSPGDAIRGGSDVDAVIKYSFEIDEV